MQDSKQRMLHNSPGRHLWAVSAQVSNMVAEEYITKQKPINFDTGSCPTFLDWLWERYQVTPTIQRVLCKQTARYGSGRKEFESCMEWYRKRYRYEMELREQLINNNPFKEEN